MTAIAQEFAETFDQARPQVPTPPNKATAAYRLRLIEEEFKEVRFELRQLMLADECGTPMEKKLAILGRLLKELADLRYVVEGTAVACGLDLDGAYVVVHVSNMSKIWDDGTIHTDAGGKVIKPPHYESPSMDDFIHITDEEA
jgi:predicted HAD superfamily Cof-like phosphohydrolase